MSRLSRRQFLAVSLAATAGGILSACSNTPTQQGRVLTAEQRPLQLLFYADTHAQWMPVYPHPAACYLSPMSLLGQAPYVTENSLLSTLSLSFQQANPWLTATSARQQPQLMGGYARMADRLQNCRKKADPNSSLTLEGGQCWNGSGLSQLTEGRYGPQSSQWLGADVKVASEEAKLWPSSVKSLYKEFAAPVVGEEQALHLFNRSDVNIAVIGVTDPWLSDDEGVDEQLWLANIQQQINAAHKKEAALTVLLCDAGTAASFWLAQHLTGADLILSSRSQDFWPTPLVLRREGKDAIPVCLAGSQGIGFHELTLSQQGGRWKVDSLFHPLIASNVAPDPYIEHEIKQLRAPHASWLGQPLAVTPDWLYRRDALAGSWDQLLAEALKSQGAELTLTPGLRHGLALPPGSVITRDDILSLTAGYPAPVFNLTVSQAQIHSRLETGADQVLSEDWWLHSGEDMPRLSGCSYVLRYQALTGKRISDLNWPAPATSDKVRLSGWSPKYQGEGIPVWQMLEDWLRKRPLNWQLPAIERPQVAFIEGHPGWHPEALN